MKNIYICHTQYHVLITILKTLKEKKAENEIILYTTIQEVEKINERLENLKIFEKVYIFNESDQIMRPIGEESKNQFDFRKKLKSTMKKYQDFFQILEDKEIYVFNDDSIIGNYLRFNKKEYNLIEDGLNCYQSIEKHYCFDRTLKERLKTFLNTPDTCFGKSKYVKEIEVNTKEGVKVYIKKKMRELPRNELFENLTEQEKKDIISVFLDNVELDTIQNATLLITQPLWKDGFLETEEKQIQIYQEIIQQYAKGQVIVKAHPRDEIDYCTNLDGSIVLKREFPVELLNFVGKARIERAITICSTAIDGIEFAKEKIKLGYEWMENYKNGK